MKEHMDWDRNIERLNDMVSTDDAAVINFANNLTTLEELFGKTMGMVKTMRKSMIVENDYTIEEKIQKLYDAYDEMYSTYVWNAKLYREEKNGN